MTGPSSLPMFCSCEISHLFKGCEGYCMTCSDAWQAIFGERPFNGRTIPALREEQQRWVRTCAVPSADHLSQQ